ncbi:zinc cluster transcriptional activator [Hyaloraphidium curvatum]|nr:zinc cluster transcriptional activator [Hyaloraphidium curvatum]
MDGSVPGAAPKPRPAKTRTAPGGGGGGAVPADGQRAASLPPLALNGVGGPGGLAPLEPQWVINDAAAALGLQHFARAHLDGLHGLNHGMPLPLGVQDGGLQGGGAPGPSGTPRQPKDAAAKKAAKADAKGDKPKKEKRKKVTQACVYCRRSHMTCDVGRPCQRCVKRNIAHLCHDDNKQAGADGQSVRSTSPELVSPSDHGLMSASGSGNHLLGFDATTAAQVLGPLLSSTHPLTTESGQLHEFGDHDHALANLDSYGLGSLAAFPPLFAAEHSGHEFSILSDFLSSLDDGGHFRDLVGSQSHPILLSSTHDAGGLLNGGPSHGGSGAPPTPHQPSLQPPPQISTPSSDGLARDKTERFILTAADPDDNADAQEDRLTRVIHAKFEAGLLKPYNYHNGYVRLQNYMENHVEPASRNRILSVISAIRPAFRSVGQSLTDLDLVLVEEHFERLLLEYDRVFTSVGVPACLWRRTGEIWKSNREFANLVQLPMERLSMGRTCIYELMQEDSAVNYWEKYGNIAFDEGQKAVLTSCVLKNPDGNPMGHPGLLAGNATELFASDLATAERERRASISGPPGKRGSSSAVMPAPSGRKTVPCCFSFTIRRDRYGMPILITGNFLPSVQEY